MGEWLELHVSEDLLLRVVKYGFDGLSWYMPYTEVARGLRWISASLSFSAGRRSFKVSTARSFLW